MYLLDKMSTTKAQQAKAKAEAEKAKAEAEKRGLLSQLGAVRTELQRGQSSINQCIQNENKETVAEFETQLKKIIYSSLSNYGPPVPNTVTFDISSLSQKISELKEKQHKSFEQLLIIQDLIQKISSSESIQFSELEKQIIAILSVKSFLESQAVARLQGMINLCPSIRQCLQLLETYSEKFFKGMKYGPNEEEHPDEVEDDDEIPKKIDPTTMKPFFEKLDMLLRQLMELQRNIYEIKEVFSAGYSLESPLSVCHELLSLRESSRPLQDALEQTTLDFQNFRKKVVEFFEKECTIRKNSFDYDTAFDDDYSTFHSQFNEIWEQLEESLKIIK